VRARAWLFSAVVLGTGCRDDFNPGDGEGSSGSTSGSGSGETGPESGTGTAEGESGSSEAGTSDTDGSTDEATTEETGEPVEVCNGDDDDDDGSVDEWGPDNPDCMVPVPASGFTMGCSDADDGCGNDELPRHDVQLSDYEIDVTEVTQAAYEDCVQDGACTAPNTGYSPGSTPDLPVVNVAWSEAKAYCEWRGKRLPTEAEWEKAARGAEDPIYPWGNDSPTCQLCNFFGCGMSSIPVGSRPAGASPYGAHDMAGNAVEWVADWYDPLYYTLSPSQDPGGPPVGSQRVARGGGFGGIASNQRSSKRFAYAPGGITGNLGFRCAR
jgi:formylglycine-generating enzyme required for sulfatase activity